MDRAVPIADHADTARPAVVPMATTPLRLAATAEVDTAVGTMVVALRVVEAITGPAVADITAAVEAEASTAAAERHTWVDIAKTKLSGRNAAWKQAAFLRRDRSGSPA